MFEFFCQNPFSCLALARISTIRKCSKPTLPLTVVNEFNEFATERAQLFGSFVIELTAPMETVGPVAVKLAWNLLASIEQSRFK